VYFQQIINIAWSPDSTWRLMKAIIDGICEQVDAVLMRAALVDRSRGSQQTA
jgi:hypothetical protein